MLTLKLLRESPDFVIRRLAVKNFDAKDIVAQVIALDDKRKALQTESDALLAEQKKAAAAIGQLMKEGNSFPTSPMSWYRKERAQKTTWS